jgi:hypothetical protein
MAQGLEAHHLKIQREGHGSPVVFCSQNGRSLWPSSIYRHLWRYIVREANLCGLRVRDLRHTSAALLRKAGVDPNFVVARLGVARTY